MVNAPDRTGDGEYKDKPKRKSDFNYVVASGGVACGMDRMVLGMAVVVVAFLHVRWVRMPGK